MYRLKIMPKAESGLARLDATVVPRVQRKMDRLCEGGPMGRHKALKGKDRGKFSVPVGDYRIIYSFNTGEQELIVHRIGHRRSVY